MPETAVILFLAQTVIISLTGVLAPGPMTAAAVGTGSVSPHAGVRVAVGHGIVEFPLMALIYYGLGDVLEIPSVRGVIFGLGGAFLLYMGADMLRSVGRAAAVTGNAGRRPLIVGMVLSLGNAYFLVWWATVGASLISRAVTFGIAGVMTFALVHWSCDLGWFWFLSAASNKGGEVFGIRFQKVVFLVCGAFLLVFGVLFLRDALNLLA